MLEVKSKRVEYVCNFNAICGPSTCIRSRFDQRQSSKTNSPIRIQQIAVGENAQTLQNASEDFQLILDGEEPKHAKLEFVAPDGGSRIFRGNGYFLESRSRMITLLGVQGFLIGPVLSFQAKKAEDMGNSDQAISNVQFYERGVLQKKRDSK